MIGRGFWRRTYRKMTDEELARAFLASGAEAYFDELFERYHALVYGLCLKLTKHRENSKDLTLITFQRAHADLSTQAPQRFRHWLFTLCRNECYRHRRLAKARAQAAETWQASKDIRDGITANAAFREELYARESFEDQLLRDGMETLSSEQKQCLELFIFEWKSYREIAQLTGYELSAVQSHLQNGRLRLKRWIDRQQGK